MNDAAAVRVGNRVGDCDDIGQQCQACVEIGRLGDDLLEGAAVAEQLHDVERPSVGCGARVVHRHDRRMLKPRGDGRFALEALLIRIRLPRSQELLDGDGSVEHVVMRRQYPAQPTAREFAHHDVARTARFQLDGRRVRHGTAAPRDRRLERHHLWVVRRRLVVPARALHRSSWCARVNVVAVRCSRTMLSARRVASRAR